MCDELDQSLEICISAIDALAESAEFKRTLEIILAIGNYLNAGTKNELCYGFDIDILLKLENTKSQVDPESGRAMSLLEFIVDYCHHNDEDVCKYWEFMVSVLHAAARVETAWLQGQATKLKLGLTQISEEVLKAEKADQTVDRFYPVMSAFVAAAEPKLARLRRKLLSLDQSVTRVTRYLGTELQQQDLFQLLVQFSSDWMDAQRRMDQDEAKRIREIKQAEAKEELAHHAHRSTPHSAGSPPSPSAGADDQQAGKVDAVMSVLRDSNKENIRSAITKRRTKAEEGGAMSRKAISRVKSKTGAGKTSEFSLD